MSLSLSLNSPRRVAHPSAEASLALQALYNIALRPHESVIFAGLLSSYVASIAPRATDAFQDGQVYGPWTPTKGMAEADISQWTTLTPNAGSEWPSLGTTLASGSGLTPRRPFSPALGLPPIGLSDPAEGSSRPVSRAEGDGLNGIDEILAQIEDTNELRENEANASVDCPEWLQTRLEDHESDHLGTEFAGDPDKERNGSESSTFSSESPVDQMVGSRTSSPFVSAASMFSVTSASTTIPLVPLPSDTPQDLEKQPTVRPVAKTAASFRSRQQAPKQLDLPIVPFIPPPPMCMFFSPTFRDLQKDKVGVWKGDLSVRGRGGGTFNILIVGEQGSDHLW